MYDNIIELQKEILAGEDSLLEFKEVVFKGDKIKFAREESKASKVIAEVFISMANTEGGVVLFGIDDDGNILGIPNDKKSLLEQFVVNLSINNCNPPILSPIIDWKNIPDDNNESKLCLKVDIPKSKYQVHQTTDGRFLKRVGSHRTPIPPEELGRMLATRKLLMPFEERPAFGSAVSDFDFERFKAYYCQRFDKTPEENNSNIEQLIFNLKLAFRDKDNLFLSNLGVLLFTENPHKWLNGAYIDIVAYDHDEPDGNSVDSRKIYGTVPEQIEQTLHYFQTSPLVAIASKKTGTGRTDKPAYSLLAIQEAVVNALVHREYELTGSQVRIFLFPNRIEIWSPGTLHNTLTVDDLFAGCQPMRRNQQLAGFLREFKSPLTNKSYMEARGEGFLNMIRESQKVSGKKPQLKLTGKAVCLSLFA